MIVQFMCRRIIDQLLLTSRPNSKLPEGKKMHWTLFLIFH